MLGKIKLKVYDLLRKDARHNKLNIVIEYVISAAICLNVVLIVYESFLEDGEYSPFILFLRLAFFIFFAIEYILRIWIADIPTKGMEYPFVARTRYILSVTGLINLLALLPVMLGSGNMIIDFRIFRILRLIRITQNRTLKRYTDVLERVIRLKGAQLMTSLFLIFIFMLFSAAIVYDLENKAQPHIFDNILSSLWWAVSTFTTIGYGDMYPITPLGKFLGSCLSFFGYFLMAIPVGILTTGFLEVSRHGHNDNEKKKHI